MLPKSKRVARFDDPLYVPRGTTDGEDYRRAKPAEYPCSFGHFRRGLSSGNRKYIRANSRVDEEIDRCVAGL